MKTICIKYFSCKKNEIGALKATKIKLNGRYTLTLKLYMD